MSDSKAWHYDEHKQVGTDYGSTAEVEIYDSSHADFRDVEAENSHILDLLEIAKDDVVIDFGSGTGSFAIQAAQRCSRVHAVDVSKAMHDYAISQADRIGVTNVEFHHAGFLTYEHRDSPVDAIFTTFALHHLPDLWKAVALTRMKDMLKPKGQLYIHDVILNKENTLQNIATFVENLATAGGKSLREDTERHFREEYSTYDWVMDGLLSDSGFTIETKKIESGVLGTYVCTRN